MEFGIGPPSKDKKGEANQIRKGMIMFELLDFIKDHLD